MSFLGTKTIVGMSTPCRRAFLMTVAGFEPEAITFLPVDGFNAIYLPASVLLFVAALLDIIPFFLSMLIVG